MSKYLQDSTLQSLLPAIIADDKQFQAVANALDPMLHALVRSLPNLLIFGRLGKQKAEQMLPALQRLTDFADPHNGLAPLSPEFVEQLAWQFHVDFRELAKTPEDLAVMAKDSIVWHRLKGTPAGMKMAFALFGMPVEIEEDGKGDNWATYQLKFENIQPDILNDTLNYEMIHQIWAIACEMQPARCSLYRIYTEEYDLRPIVLSDGPALSEGLLSFYSGVSVPKSYYPRPIVLGEEPTLLEGFLSTCSAESVPGLDHDLIVSFVSFGSFGSTA